MSFELKIIVVVGWWKLEPRGPLTQIGMGNDVERRFATFLSGSDKICDKWT